MAPKPKGKTSQQLRASIERKRSLWLSAQEGNAEAQIQLGREWLDQKGDEEGPQEEDTV
jgi:hypothetical protein